MRRRVLAVVLAATLGILGAGSASATAVSHISIRWNATTERFHGKVTSTDAECVAGRTVKLFKVTANGPVLRGKTHTGVNGGWRIEVMHPPHGHFYAKTPTEKIMHTLCGGDRSPTIDVM
jgi:hypothetical protein